MEVPGKSSSDSDPQGASFSGDTLLGSPSDAVDRFLCHLCIITPLLHTPHIWFCFLTSGDNPQLDLEGVVGPGLHSLSNDEAAMAVILSLLETDTNLEEAVDFEEMHWSL